MDALVKDLRIALRMFVSQPALSAMAVFTLAMGIGANGAIFSFAKVTLLDALPYRDEARLVMVWQDYQRRGGPAREWFSYPNFVDYRTRSRTLEDMAVFSAESFVITGSGEPEAVAGERVSASFFDVLGARFVQGRGFRAEEELGGAPPVAVLSHRLWQKRFHGDPAIVGGGIEVDDRPYTVVGVLAPEFYPPFESDAELVLPLTVPPPEPNARRQVTLRAVGRMR
ncbi:MAG: permease, partial [Thermoanaerobaculia bacterium]|nr:permease [Thermoanaerobaculia bacterium]